MNFLETLELKKIERVKELLEIPSNQRNEKMLLELMSFTRVKLNFNIIYI
jgi:hypothetical protein